MYVVVILLKKQPKYTYDIIIASLQKDHYFSSKSLGMHAC